MASAEPATRQADEARQAELARQAEEELAEAVRAEEKRLAAEAAEEARERTAQAAAEEERRAAGAAQQAGEESRPRWGSRPRRKAWHRELERFLRVNKLEPDGPVDRALRELEPHIAREVMGVTGTNTFELTGDVRDKSAVVLARIRRMEASRRGWRGPVRAR